MPHPVDYSMISFLLKQKKKKVIPKSRDLFKFDYLVVQQYTFQQFSNTYPFQKYPTVLQIHFQNTHSLPESPWIVWVFLIVGGRKGVC